MINEINKFFNERPLLAVALIILMLVLLYQVVTYKIETKQYSEHMSSVSSITPTPPTILPKCTVNSDQEFNAMYTGQSKVLNFKCTIADIDYYLTCVKIADYDTNNTNKTPDCQDSMLILVPATEINTMLSNYMKNMSTAEMICNSTMKIKCEQALPAVASEEDKQQCNKLYDVCEQTRFFLHDFKVTDTSVTTGTQDPMSLRKYIIKGTALPMINGSSAPAMFNQFLYNDNGINIVCGDTFAYGAPTTPKEYAEIVILERSSGNAGGIIGASSTLKIKIRFNTLLQIVSKNPDGTPKNIPLVDQCTGNLKTKPSYMGFCPTAQNCTKDGKSYLRLCLYDDILNPNVLEFEPSIVNTK